MLSVFFWSIFVKIRKWFLSQESDFRAKFEQAWSLAIEVGFELEFLVPFDIELVPGMKQALQIFLFRFFCAFRKHSISKGKQSRL